ncbi:MULTISPECIES: transcription-repair coupling factor [unclassified Thermoactinomyces]|uniref:transcription-repair coupling factor n=1 Tax=unclassified Thermoactinomyces TaxID=2634588 RepID=UPI0018DB7D2B|nr:MULTISPECIES: transcription-repair coupling factor [unclassified Thermoactinomyces]MBH8598768.1 transcription-repair coupling factor [Thermoactinomyces sp. CICC 10523]MBH8604753.1 transcription-repair coupling factor [Thermoactinomyces sp. CICC 10522]MBH8607421.1 transcription-repair coupling factor [Thermoactinomyces sp. CICC 10521]
MMPLIHIFKQDHDFQSTVEGLKAGLKDQLVSGLTGTARMLYIAAVYQESKRPMLLVCHNLNQAQKAADDLQEILPKEEVLLYPANELVTTEIAMAGHETLGDKIDVLSRLSLGFNGVLIVPFSGLRKLFPPKSVFAQNHVHLKVGMVQEIEPLVEQLVKIGYRRVDMVEKPGECSVRGGIVDIYPVNFARPVRIEWFDDEVDSIRPFSVSDQRSIDKWQEVLLPPATELFADADRLYQAGEQVEKLLAERLANVKNSALKQKLTSSIGYDIEQLKSGAVFAGIYKYIDCIYPNYESLLDYMPKETVMILDEPTRIMESAKQMEREEGEWQTALLGQGEFLPQLKISLPYDEVILKSRPQRIFLSLFMRQIPGVQPQNIIQAICRSMQQFHGQMHVLKTEWDRWVKAQYRVLFLASSEERAERLERVLADYGMKIERDNPVHLPLPGKPVIRVGTLQNGFEMSGIRLAVVTESEVFTQKQRRTRRHVKLDHAEKIKDYQELKPGDYVVHVNHGIGRYVGIETLNVGGMHKDYLHIQYAGNDKLYVPVEQIDQVQKYIGSEEKAPKVYSLGGSEWSKVKNKVRTSVQDIAQDLIELYAKRQQAKGYSFAKDTPYQKEFEAMFPYEETPDQLRSIEEIKQDMEKEQPMDRLLCGDVGYGKTEVAIRAAFKATMDGKQVAVLVPTTILAQQHFETFRERFSGFPVQIHVLSRFRSRKEQKETIEGLANGTVDIVIGTHRLLSKDITFRDLGLLIIDEEQRFGVKHKEKIKQLKHNIDVLTLSATPIPRTLHMAMMGVRDLSVIETPPENRFPVQTYVLEYSAALVREAVERELARGGQVYFLYNQVQNIEQMAEQIRMLVPEARVAVAHGQMPETELEKVMLDFLDGEFDVLVSTTIIETGVDIPNVNTLIIYDADKMGLSQLYQLRGRVGRSNRIAYAYFTYQRDKVLSETAEKRLQAIKEFTELGSGFKIAMRDLSIRGAGNILGAEQHGHIATVGFELYSQMLKEAINELQGKNVQEQPGEPVIDLSVDAYLPSGYIRDEKQKIELYKKIRGVTELDEVSDLEEEIEDRFGDLPEPVQMLLKIAKIKAFAMSCGIEAIEQKDGDISLLFHPSQNEKIDGQKLFQIAQDFPGKIRFSTGEKIGVVFKVKGMSSKRALEMVEQFLIKYKDVPKLKGAVKNATG